MLGPPSFARGLRTLIFGYGFNQILDEVKFPEALQTLTFGDGFKKSASISGDAVLLLFGYVWIVLLYLKKYVRETPMSPGKRSKAIVLHTISHYVTWLRAKLQHTGTVSLGMHNVLLPSNLRSLIFGSASDPMWRCLAEVPTICGWDMLKYFRRNEHNFCRPQWYPISVCQVTKWCFCASMLSGLSHVTLPSNLQSLALKAPHCHAYLEFVDLRGFGLIRCTLESNMAGWEIPELNRGFNGKFIDKWWWIFCHDYQRVHQMFP